MYISDKYSVNFDTNSISIKAPATSANVGVGFDCFGLAIDIYNRYKIERTENSDRIVIWKEKKLVNDEQNLVFTTINHILDSHYKHNLGFNLYMLEQNIPLARGMGSSSACIVAGILLGAWLCKEKISKYDALKIATKFEGHPDNATPAIYGDFCISKIIGDTQQNFEDILVKKINFFDDVQILLAYPDFELSTKEARKVMPKSYSSFDMIKAISNASLLISALHTNDINTFKQSLDDVVHEPYRYPLISGSKQLIRSIEKSPTFIANSISGSGSTLIFYFNKIKNSDINTYVSEETIQEFSNWTFKLANIDSVGAEYE